MLNVPFPKKIDNFEGKNVCQFVENNSWMVFIDFEYLLTEKCLLIYHLDRVGGGENNTRHFGEEDEEISQHILF